MHPYSDYTALQAGFAADGRAEALAPAGYQMFETEPGGMRGFWQVMREDFHASQLTGWKAHISVDAADLPRAWELISTYASEQGVAAFKVAAPETAARFGDADNLQAGKMITLYDSVNGPDLQSTLAGVDALLREHGIQPGHAVRNDRAVPGSEHISYRNDYDANGQYVSNTQLEGSDIPAAERYNLSGAPDPLAQFALGDAAAPLADVAGRAKTTDVGVRAIGGAGLGLGAMGAINRAGDALHHSDVVQVQEHMHHAVAGDVSAVVVDAAGIGADIAAAHAAEQAAHAAQAAKAARIARIGTGAGMVTGGVAVGVASYAEKEYASALQEQAVYTDDDTERARLAEEAAAANGRAEWGFWAGAGALLGGAVVLLTAPVSVPVLIGVGVGGAAIGVGGAMTGDYVAREEERESHGTLHSINATRDARGIQIKDAQAKGKSGYVVPGREPEVMQHLAAQLQGGAQRLYDAEEHAAGEPLRAPLQVDERGNAPSQGVGRYTS